MESAKGQKKKIIAKIRDCCMLFKIANGYLSAKVDPFTRN